jgi:hypothetical protein
MKCSIDPHQARVDHIGHDVSAEVLVMSQSADRGNQFRQCERTMPRMSTDASLHGRFFSNPRANLLTAAAPMLDLSGFF